MTALLTSLRAPLTLGDMIGVAVILIAALVLLFWPRQRQHRHHVKTIEWVTELGDGAHAPDWQCRQAIFDTPGFRDLLDRVANGQLRMLYVYARIPGEYLVVWIEPDTRVKSLTGVIHVREADHVTVEDSWPAAVRQSAAH